MKFLNKHKMQILWSLLSLLIVLFLLSSIIFIIFPAIMYSLKFEKTNKLLPINKILAIVFWVFLLPLSISLFFVNNFYLNLKKKKINWYILSVILFFQISLLIYLIFYKINNIVVFEGKLRNYFTNFPFGMTFTTLCLSHIFSFWFILENIYSNKLLKKFFQEFKLEQNQNNKTEIEEIIFSNKYFENSHLLFESKNRKIYFGFANKKYDVQKIYFDVKKITKEKLEFQIIGKNISQTILFVYKFSKNKRTCFSFYNNNVLKQLDKNLEKEVDNEI